MPRRDRAPAPGRPLTPWKAAQIRRHTCGRKLRHRSRRAALRQVAAMVLDGRDVAGLRPYLCPFHRPDEPRHWHVGHVPDIGGLAKVARAIRFGPTPGRVQHPRSGQWFRVDPWSGANMGRCPPPPPPPSTP